MAAIARDRVSRCAPLLITAIIAALPSYARAADPSSSARQQVAAVAEALSSGDAAEAMTHFAKTMPDFEKIRRYFEGLSAFQVDSEVSFTDEDDSETAVVFTVAWQLTLTDQGTDRTRNRSGDIHVKVVPVDSKWRIVEFSPLDIFNPQVH